MVRLYPIVPHAYLTSLKTRRYFLIATDLPEQIPKGRSRQMILDNGAYEAATKWGRLAGAFELAEIGISLRTNEIIAPDVWQDLNATVRQFREFYESFSGSFENIIGVVQGKTPRELLLCVAELVAFGAEVVGIPKWIHREFPDERIWLAKWANEHGAEVHFLGLDDPDELRPHLVHKPWIRSVDTTLPAHLALQLHRWSVNDHKIPRKRRPANYFGLPFDARVAEIMNENILRMGKYLGDPFCRRHART